MKTIKQRLIINLEEIEGLHMASIDLPSDIANELNEKQTYIIGFDGQSLSATTQN